MTKTNAQAATAAKATKAKKVLGVEDIVIGGKPGKTARAERAEIEAELRRISAATGAPRAALANGLTGRSAPQSAKAIADASAKAKASNKADAAIAAAAAKLNAKAGKAAPAAKATAPAKGDRKYKWIGENKAREGTWRHAMLACAASNTTTGAGDTCMAKNKHFASHKMDWRWMAAQGYIKWID